MTTNGDPLVAAPPAEVPLRQAPLVRVIAQVRFPIAPAVDGREFIASFQKALGEQYPVLRQERASAIFVGPAGAAPPHSDTVWRLSDVKADWRVSLARDFLARETKAYQSRDDFLGRLRNAVAVLNEQVQPQLVDRLGVRYIDRISGDAGKDLHKLVRSELLGIVGTPAAARARHTLSESLFVLDGKQLLARWGCLPGGATTDAAAIEPTTERSWILDLDMFSTEAAPFSVDSIVKDARLFSERIYTFFRWAVTEQFLRRYGGSV